MARASIPVYDICTISRNGPSPELLVENFAAYLDKHYQDLHHPHRHSFYHLVLFTKGGGTHTIDFVQYPVKPFQVYFMAPGQVHSWDFKGTVDGYIIHFMPDLFRSFLLDPAYLERFSFFSGVSAQGVLQLPAALHKPVLAICDAILKETQQKQAMNMDMVCLRLLELFITVERSSTGGAGLDQPGHRSTLLRNFRQLINQRYRTMRLPRDYAELLHITPNHLNALCMETLGKTAGDVIRERVLLEAKRLLTNAHMSILEIAYDLNFRDNSYFARFFRKYEGITPEAFRKKFVHQ